MHPQRAPTLRVDEDVDAINWVRVHRRHYEAGFVRADRDEAEVEGTAQLTDLLEGRAVRVFERGIVVVDAGRESLNCAITGVSVEMPKLAVDANASAEKYSPSEPHLLPSAFYAPRGPQRVSLVEAIPRAHMLAREGADCCLYCLWPGIVSRTRLRV